MMKNRDKKLSVPILQYRHIKEHKKLSFKIAHRDIKKLIGPAKKAALYIEKALSDYTIEGLVNLLNFGSEVLVVCKNERPVEWKVEEINQDLIKKILCKYDAWLVFLAGKVSSLVAGESNKQNL